MSRPRLGPAVAVLVLCAACAAPTALSPTVVTSSSLSVQASAVPSSSSRPPKQPAVVSSSDEVGVNIDGSCPSHEPYVRALKSVSDSATTIVGVATATGRHVVASPDAFVTRTQVVYAEVTVTVQRQLLGPELPRHIKVYLPGGSVGRFKTTVTSILESAWAVDGRFFGTVSPGTAVAGTYEMNVLPLAGNLISFAGVGCLVPLGLPLSSDRSKSTALVMDDGEVTRRSGQYLKVDLASVEMLLG